MSSAISTISMARSTPAQNPRGLARMTFILLIANFRPFFIQAAPVGLPINLRASHQPGLYTRFRGQENPASSTVYGLEVTPIKWVLERKSTETDLPVDAAGCIFRGPRAGIRDGKPRFLPYLLHHTGRSGRSSISLWNHTTSCMFMLHRKIPTVWSGVSFRIPPLFGYFSWVRVGSVAVTGLT